MPLICGLTSASMARDGHVKSSTLLVFFQRLIRNPGNFGTTISTANFLQKNHLILIIYGPFEIAIDSHLR